MVILFLRFTLRQLATALVVVTSILLLSEILLPGSILPYFNLHILIVVTLMIAIASPILETPTRPLRNRILHFIFCLFASVPFLIYAWLLFGMSVSGLMLLGALGIVLVGVTVALSTAAPSWVPPPLAPPQDEEKVDIFMR